MCEVPPTLQSPDRRGRAHGQRCQDCRPFMPETLPALLPGALLPNSSCGKPHPPLTPGDPGSRAHPSTCGTKHMGHPRAIPVIGEMGGPIQLSHSHTKQPGGRVGPWIDSTHSTWNPFPEPPPPRHSQPGQGVPTDPALGASDQPGGAYLWAPWERPHRMATSRVAATAGPGVAAMPLLTCKVTAVESNSQSR